ncbi:DUF5518 domain-containing protein [Methanobacterium formicicum]|uniref:Putative membrane protein n=1 Tax=Methanobacterium formicicum TaxID=2162 RepID=A0A090I4Z9_METFO|nr:DUF5518 domain-containing protein [Methanobacterium formicicum]MDH2658537.1 DUF5518 domain-containing protein [Methanobacterium formicicum]CEA14568.1 putative membrane protein [Methanobacterium formicicum]
MENINWKAVLAGSATAIVLGVLSSFLLMLSPIYSYGIYVGFLIGALLTGYMVGGTYVEGAKHGIVMGIITAIILGGVSMIFDLIFPREAPASIVIMGEMYALIITLIVCSAVGSILGGIGAEIKGYKFNMGKVGGEKIKVNWKAVIAGFGVTFLIALFTGLYLPKMGLIAPVIGGFIALYLVEVIYINGIFYGGLPTSIAGLISAPLVVFLSPNQTNIQVANLNISPETITAISYILGTISGFILFLFIGTICGIIAVAVQKKTNKKGVYILIAAVVIVLVFILANVIRVGAVLSTFGPA